MKPRLLVSIVLSVALLVIAQNSYAGRATDTLKLIGEGTFRYLGMKLYTARFYLDARVVASGQMRSDMSKKLVIRYLRDIPRDALIKAAEKNLRNNPRVDFERLKERIDKLHQYYANLKKGDEYELFYSEGKTRLYHNGLLKTQIEGFDFASAYFAIWVSEHSISQKLTRDLLGRNK